jgi:hypothetical protein
LVKAQELFSRPGNTSRKRPQRQAIEHTRSAVEPRVEPAADPWAPPTPKTARALARARTFVLS